jgi:hypothetical protein
MLAARRRGGQRCDEIGSECAHYPRGEDHSAVWRDERIATELTSHSLDRCPERRRERTLNPLSKHRGFESHPVYQRYSMQCAAYQHCMRRGAMQPPREIKERKKHEEIHPAVSSTDIGDSRLGRQACDSIMVSVLQTHCQRRAFQP